MSTNISLERLLDQTPEDKRYLGEPAQIREEDLEIDENITLSMILRKICFI